MGYFSNGTEGDMFEDKWCSRCVHVGPPDGPGCPVMLAHVLHNYNECNNPDSILHLLITRGKAENGFHQECRMFVDTGKTVVYRGKLPDHLKEWANEMAS